MRDLNAVFQAMQLCVQLQVDDQRIAGTEELEKSEESERLAAGVVAAGRRHTDRTQSTRLGDHQMGVCASKADELSHENKAQCSPAKRSVVTLDSSRDMSVGFKTLSFDSPGSSAEVGDIGKLGTLLCSSSSRRPQTDQEAGFSESHHEMLQRRLSGSLGEISFTSYLSSPLIREFDFHGFDAIAKSYVESAGKAAARDTFMFLKENDRALGTRSSIEQLSSDRMIHRFPLLDNSSLLDYTDQGVEAHNTLERSLDINAADAAVVQQQLQAAGHEFRLHASRPGSVVDEKEVVKTQKLLGAADNYYSQPDQTDLVIDFGVSLKPELVTSSPRPRPRLSSSSSSSSVEDHKSLFDACFPATSRWASVVNAARQSACLPTRPLIRLPNQSVITDKRKEAFAAAAAAAREMQLLQCPGTIFESTIRSSPAITQTAAVSTPASIQERVMGCCGSGEKEGLHLLQWDAKHQCASSARTMPESSACGSQQTQANSLKLRSSHQCHAIFSTIDHGVNMLPSSTTTGEDLPEGQGCLACFSLANGLRMINLPSTGKLESMSNSCSSIMLCSSSSNSKARANRQAGGSDQQLDHHDPDTDAFFSFPSSPSAAHVDEVMIADSAATYRKKNSIQPPVECGFKDCIEPSKGFKSAQPFTTQLQAARQQALGLKNHATVVPAFSKGAAFGSPFPVRCATTTTQCSCSSLSKAQQKLQQPDHFVDKNLELFSLEQACTLTLAWNSVAMDSQRSSSAITTEPESLDSPETSSSNQDLGFRDVHDTDDSSSDLFEIGNIQGTSTIMGFNRLDFPHLEPIKSTSLNTAPRQVSEISSGHCMSATPTNPGSIRNSSQWGAKAVHVANMRANSLKEQAQEKEKNAELVKEAISSCYAAAAAAGNSGQHGQGIVLMKLGLLKQKHPASKNGTAEKWHYPSSQGNKISLPIIDSENKPTPFGTTTSEAAPVTLAGQ